jgi:hypothetical protein
MNAISNIRNRFSKKSAAALLVFAVALTASGVGSLATLNDTASTVITASITSIDLQANGTKSAAIDFGQVEPGTIGYAPITLTNAGSGYLRLTAASISNGSPVSNDSRVQFIPGLGAANCNATDVPWNTITNGQTIVQSSIPLDGVGAAPAEHIIGAAGTTGPNGSTYGFCAVYKVGVSNGVGYGQTGFSTTITFTATHP